MTIISALALQRRRIYGIVTVKHKIKMQKCTFILFFVILSKMAFGSCSGKRYNLTEILLNTEDKHAVFTCYIKETYWGSGGYTSIAIVNEVFRGNPIDTIRIITGGLTTAGGRKIKPGTNWLIISETTDNLHFTATICHNLSKPLTQEDVGCGYPHKIYGNDYIKVIRQLDSLNNSHYTGNKRIYLQDSLIAQGDFKNGLTTDTWKHYYFSGHLNKQNLELEIDYKNGVPNGEYIRYIKDYLPLKIASKITILDGKDISKEVYEDRFYHYTYNDNNEKITDFHRVNEAGDTIKKYREISISNNLNYYFYAVFKHGDYLNLIDSSSYNKLCRGTYYKGAKVGIWKYYDKQGNLINQESYKFIDTVKNQFVIYDDDGSIKVLGKTKKNKQVGKWKYYHKNRLEYEELYNVKSELVTKTRYYKNIGKKVTPYINGKREGTEHTCYKSGQLSELTNYSDGIKHGKYTKFDIEGNVSYESYFKNGIESTLYRSDGHANIINGFKNGYNTQINHKTGKKMYEGLIWMGYSIGKQIAYKDNGDYTITYLETDKDLIMKSCDYQISQKVEYYNVKGELLKVDINSNQ